MKKNRPQTLTGMHDILPEEQFYFRKILDVAEKIANFYNFQKIDTPIVEQADLFSKGTGLLTDIVEKQMYVFRTRGGDIVALRPEGTPAIARAYIEHGMFNLPQPVKLWYHGPFFRYEHPQGGRLRQFNQFGFEVLGEASPSADAQIIHIFWTILQELKLKDIVCEINSIGDNQCRPYYKKILTSYYKPRVQSLCIDCRRRLKENVLRILDCKEEKCQRVNARAPQIVDHLCEECHNHFKEVLEFLDATNLPYKLNPILVRGLDYYTKTVFEIYEGQINDERPRQSALVGGGRFDSLIKVLGGKATPACGGGAGIERIVNALKQKGVKLNREAGPKVFIAQLGFLAKRKSLKLLDDFRRAKIDVAESLGKDSLKTQLGRADKLGVEYTLIFGQKEALEKTIILREMRTSKQEIIKLEKIVDTVKRRLKK